MNDFEHGLFRYLNDDQLAKVRAVKVGIAGAGGLGSNCATALVRTGFRHMRIVDFDVVECSNLNRQFYFLDQVGKPKVEMLKENLERINPAVEIEAIQMRIESDNIRKLFDGCDVVVEAFDRPECKKLIVETYMNSEKFLVAASGLAGWGNSDRIEVRRIRDNFYLVGDSVTGIGPGAPPLAPMVFIAAAKQADVVLRYILERA